MSFGKIAWLSTAIVCLVAAGILLLVGYYGYGATAAAVALSAAINLR